jgi:4-hydroxy-tetrahydrodipicolinate reductase
MGKLLEKQILACPSGMTLVSIIDRHLPPSKGKIKHYKKLSGEAIAEADVCIDFSSPSSALNNLKIAAAEKKNMVMGTTGWLDQLKEAEKIVKQSRIGFIYASNFSTGVALFTLLVKTASKLFAEQASYDVAGIEVHHNQKLDKPSGTAKSLLQLLNTQIRKKKGGIEFTSVRVGAVPGTHTVLFDSPIDTIELTHTARNRDGFVKGALDAALWLQNKQGFFTIDDFIGSI